MTTPAKDAADTAPAKKTTAKRVPAKPAPKKPAAQRPALKKPAAPKPQHPEIEGALDALEAGSRTWAGLTIAQRARLLERTKETTAAAAQEWAETAATIKGLGPRHPLRGEEWLSGPYGLLWALDAYIDTLRKLDSGATPVHGIRLDETPGGQTRAHVFPTTAMDGLLLSGFRGEVWFRPGVGSADVRRTAGLGQLTPTDAGGIGLVLGAGNVTSIPPLDVLYELLAANRVVLLKLNPTTDPLLPAYERALAPLIEPGFVRIVTGGAGVGEALVGNKRVDHVHITGSETTFNAIVWGTGGAATRRRREDRPKLRTPITGELGGVSPIIIVPGEWSDADLRFHAEHVATMRLHNSGHNCIAGQVVLLSADWPQKDAFLAHLREVFATAPQRPIWYPGAPERVQKLGQTLPGAHWFAGHTRVLAVTDEGADASAFETTEFFGPVLGVEQLPGTGQEFLDAAVAHANDRLEGTLGANVLIDPTTQKALGDGFERAIADLRYGSIAINGWTGFIFLTPTMTWGGYPGTTIENVGSGIGIVHNALLLDGVERSVLRGPFRPFPRSVPATLRDRSQATVLPKPPWFITSRTGAAVSEGFTRYRSTGSIPTLLKTLGQALRS